jgi:hypothetical protein
VYFPHLLGVFCIFSPVHVTICRGLWPPGNTTCLFLTWYQSDRLAPLLSSQPPPAPASYRRARPPPPPLPCRRPLRPSASVALYLELTSPPSSPTARTSLCLESRLATAQIGSPPTLLVIARRVLCPSRSSLPQIGSPRLAPAPARPRSRLAPDRPRPTSISLALPGQTSPDSAAGRRKRLPPVGIGLCCWESAGGAGNRPISAGHRRPVSVRVKKERERERERYVYLIGLCCDSLLPGDL